jgi:hypothetical protein
MDRTRMALFGFALVVLLTVAIVGAVIWLSLSAS